MKGGVIRNAKNNTVHEHKTIWFRDIVTQTREIQNWYTEIMPETYQQLSTLTLIWSYNRVCM